MANSRSAKKRIRQNVSARSHNRSVKSTVRTAIKSYEAAAKAGDASAAEKFVKMVKLLDTATRKGYYHKNNAARKKSRMSKLLVAKA